MSANITYLMYRSEWHRRRTEALRERASRVYQQRPPCKIYWAADCFAHRIAGDNVAPPLTAPAWRDPCTTGGLQTDTD